MAATEAQPLVPYTASALSDLLVCRSGIGGRLKAWTCSISFAGKPADFYRKSWEEFNEKNYHQPSDEFHADWDFTALQQAAEFGFLLGVDVANQDKLPDWRAGDQFHR